jgi:hypothetical protein
VSSRKTTKSIPANVLTMVAMIAIIVGGLFGLIVQSWLIGAGVGVGFAAAIYFVVIFQARQTSKKRRR